MKIEEILEMEKNNKNRINIVKEGFFTAVMNTLQCDL